jgi:hypothetical protein
MSIQFGNIILLLGVGGANKIKSVKGLDLDFSMKNIIKYVFESKYEEYFT